MIEYLYLMSDGAEQELFERLYIEQRQSMFCVAQKILGSQTDAEDAVHIGYTKLAAGFSRYQTQPYENLIKLLTVAVKHAAYDIYKSNKREVQYEEKLFQKSSVSHIEKEMLEKFEKETISDALMELSEEERDLLQMQYGMGMKPRDIGILFGVSSAAVRRKMLKVRKKLIRILEGN